MRKFPSGDARKMSLYFPQDMADHIGEHALRLDRSKSWVVQECVRLSKQALEAIVGPPDFDDDWQRARVARKAAEAAAKAKDVPKAVAESSPAVVAEATLGTDEVIDTPVDAPAPAQPAL